MYNLHLSPEQLQIRDTVRDFVAEVVKPLALKPERMEARARPLLVEALDKASQMGLRTLALSEDRGGAGADNLTCCIVTEELAVGDPDVAAVLAQTSTLAQALFDRVMTAEQRARFLPAFLADPRHYLALAEHEADRDAALGINYHRPQMNHAPFKTAAVRAGEGWVINGSKERVAGVSLAALFVVRASVGENGVATLLVPRDAPGLTVIETEAATRSRHGACGAVAFDDCRVPGENLLRADGPLAADAGRHIPQDQALNLGIGRAAYEAALDYAQLRTQGGRRIIEHQAIGAKLAEIAIRLEVARAAIWQAAWASDHPDAFADRSLPDLPLTTIAAVFASEAIYRAAKDAAECFGAMGVMRDMPLQKYVHDALVCLNSGAGNGDAKLRIAEALARYRRPATAAALAAE
ncbi:MAG TPA: acyl-CoA dehydrogenase family protein [Xanthobacteraceae bacterium]|nr:acyl-CoA dehydrogenase family protein [Xanthobacteraceae bacterium]